jgi:hypothetical protein
MSTIITLNTNDSGSVSRVSLNTNSTNLNADKQEKGTGVTGNIVAFSATNVLADTGKVAPTGVIVGTTDTQVLTNKTVNGISLSTSSGATNFLAGDGTYKSVAASYAVDTGAANAYVMTLSPAPISYGTGNIYTFKSINANTTISTLNVNGLGAITIKKLDGATDLVANDIKSGMIVECMYNGSIMQMLNPVANIIAKFGGNGSDGPLVISSGSVNVNCGGVRFITKNYSYISITGTGQLTFSNPNSLGTIITIKSQLNIDLTSSTVPNIDASGMGGAGASLVTVSGVNTSNGNSSTAGTGALFKSNGGSAGTSSVGAGGTIPTFVSTIEYLPDLIATKYSRVLPGSGGANGNVGSNTGGTATSPVGGNGGTALIIECGGYWNFNVSNGISVAGKNGSNGTATVVGIAAGSSAGSGGMFMGITNFVTSNSGTINVTGGIGGNSFLTGTTGNMNGGGSGASSTVAGNPGTTTGSSGVKTGADGVSGISLGVVFNTEFI